jgi:hypothetical protein
MEHRISQGTLIDVEVEKQIQNDRQKWREVLKRIVACIKFLASQNLALRGHCESLAEHDNTECFNIGNFLTTMKLIAQFDPLLSNHLQHAMDVPGSVSYLSPRIQNEFISLLASTVRRQILCDIRRNKYYGLMLDSTPDLAHREQLSEVIRFVDVNFITKKVTIKEAFLGFIDGTELFAEISDCNMLLKSRPDAAPRSPLALLLFIISYGNDIFPNLRIALQIMLTICVSVASCERSFSKLNLILTYSRASMGQERLSDLALLSIEKELVETINFDDVIDNFASAKSRKVVL